MQFQFFELHVQHAIWETRLHVQTSNCMSISELHVEHAVWCIIRWTRNNSNNKMHVHWVWCFMICISHSNLHVQHVILFLSDMHIEVSHMHVWHADRRCWMHVGHHIVKSKIMTNMVITTLMHGYHQRMQNYGWISSHLNCLFQIQKMQPLTLWMRQRVRRKLR